MNSLKVISIRDPNVTEKMKKYIRNELFHDGVPCHIESSPLVCSENQWTGFYMIGTSIMKEIN